MRSGHLSALRACLGGLERVTRVQGKVGRSRRGRCCAGASQLCAACAAFFGWLWGFEPAVKRWIRTNGAPGATVDDVASEVFTVAWRRLDVVPGGRTEAERWLFAVARRTLSNQRRSMAREARRIERIVARGGAGDPGAHGYGHNHGHGQGYSHGSGYGHAGAERLAVVQAWQSLSPEDAEVLRLVGWVGLGLDQLAERLGCRRGAAAMRLSRARTRLESLLSL